LGKLSTAAALASLRRAFQGKSSATATAPRAKLAAVRGNMAQAQNNLHGAITFALKVCAAVRGNFGEFWPKFSPLRLPCPNSKLGLIM
jgi:hypothetical protein